MRISWKEMKSNAEFNDRPEKYGTCFEYRGIKKRNWPIMDM